ncbi:MAG TPA: hypothetical protein VK870_16275 [Ignavibacteriaceae bacterium]|nr:hypothetical protein [Ignavibacteriaceae bacterium]
MSDPYKRKLVNHNFYHSKVDINGKFVVVLDGKLENRGLNLIQPISRAFPQHTIIELIGTDEQDAKPGSMVNNICYIGFVELLNSGVILTGDKIFWNDSEIGTIAGYDDTHMPNHQNTIVLMKDRISGKELGIKNGDKLVIKGFEK